MKLILLTLITLCIVTGAYLCKNKDKTHPSKGPGCWDKVYNPKDLAA
jgi:hypothetical protein